MPHLPHPVPHAALLALAVTAGLFFAFHTAWLGDLSQPLWVLTLFVWLFLVIIWGATAVVHQAERLAEFLGEPLGTLILTLSVASIEVMIIAMVMITGNDNPALARDTIFSVTMIVLNGLVGLALLVGGWRYREQEYNLRGVNAFLSLTPGPGRVHPDPAHLHRVHRRPHVQPRPGDLSDRDVHRALRGLPGGSTARHRGYFLHPGLGRRPYGRTARRIRPADGGAAGRPLGPVVFLAENLAVILNHGIEALGAPPALGALAVAIMVLFPEGLAAVRSALANELQRAINLLLGSVLATLALTAPAVVIIGLVRRTPVVLGLEGVKQPLLMLTLLLAPSPSPAGSRTS